MGKDLNFFFVYLSAGHEEEQDAFPFTRTSFNVLHRIILAARPPLKGPVPFVFTRTPDRGVAIAILQRLWYHRGQKHKLSMRLLTKE